MYIYTHMFIYIYEYVQDMSLAFCAWSTKPGILYKKTLFFNITGKEHAV